MVKKKYIFIPIVFVLIASALCCCSIVSGNFVLEINELKAYFKPTVHISYAPEIKDIERVAIGGAILAKVGKRVYSDGSDIMRISNCLADRKYSCIYILCVI